MTDKALSIGPYTLPNNLFLAPMAGVTDRPFRQLCRKLGAGMAVSEMIKRYGPVKNHCYGPTMKVNQNHAAYRLPVPIHR